MKFFFLFLIFLNFSFSLNAEENPAPFGIKLGEHISKSFEGNLNCSINETVEDYKLYRCSIDPPKPDRHFEYYDIELDNFFEVWKITATKEIEKKDEKYYKNFVKNLGDILIQKYNLTRIIDIGMCRGVSYYSKGMFKNEKIYFKQKNQGYSHGISKNFKELKIPDSSNLYELCKLDYMSGKLKGFEFLKNQFNLKWSDVEELNAEQKLEYLNKYKKNELLYNLNFSYIPTTLAECFEITSKFQAPYEDEYDCNTEMLLSNQSFEIKIRLKELIPARAGYDLHIHYYKTQPFGLVDWVFNMEKQLNRIIEEENNRTINESNF